VEITGELLDPVNIAASLDLDRHRHPALVARENVDWADRGHVLAAHEGVSLAQQFDLVGEQLLQVRLDAVLDETRVDAELVRAVVQNLEERDDQAVGGLLVSDLPLLDDTGGAGVILELEGLE